MHPTSRFVHKIADYSIWIVRAVVDDYTMRQFDCEGGSFLVPGLWFLVMRFIERREAKPHTRNQKPGTRNQEPETRTQKPGTRNQKPLGWKKSNVPAV